MPKRTIVIKPNPKFKNMSVAEIMDSKDPAGEVEIESAWGILKYN